MAAAVVTGIFGLVTIAQEGQQEAAGFLREERKASYVEFLLEYDEFNNAAIALFSYASEVGRGARAPQLEEFNRLAATVDAEVYEALAAHWTVKLVGSEDVSIIASQLLFDAAMAHADIDDLHAKLQPSMTEEELRSLIGEARMPPSESGIGTVDFINQARIDLGVQ